MFAKETYGGFLEQSDLDNATKVPIDALLVKAQEALARIDKEIPDEASDSKFIENCDSSITRMSEQHVQ